jgi:alkylation response protein AidB-like acyl-CoA dehydrogenase
MADDLFLSSDHVLFRDALRAFVDKEVCPVADALDQKESFPWELFRRLAGLGYFGVRYPGEYGGSGGDNLMYSIMCEELARGWLSLAAAVAAHTSLGTMPIFRNGSEGQRHKYISAAIRGEKIAGLALSEPGAGSDVASLRTTAIRRGDHYVLNGSKTFTTNGPVADFVTVAAKTNPDAGMKGISLFVVEKDTPGFIKGRKLQKLGTWASETGELFFEECKVPVGAMLGEENRGFINLMQTLTEGRVMTASLAIGIARAALEASLTYAKERVQFGQPIGKFQSMQFRLAEMATELEAARHLVYHAARLSEKGVPFGKEASMAKLFASEVASRITSEASIVFGGYGYMMEYPVQRYFRDARFLLYGEGTSDIQKMIIARELGL